MKSKKGFTLIELLAVIVILGVIMLLGVTAVLPLMNRAQKNALASEGIGLLETGKTAHNAEQMKASSTLNLRSNKSYCFSIDWLKKHSYYEKESEKYFGSVLIYFNGDGTFSYFFWISNDKYHIAGGTADNYTIEDGQGDESMNTCGGLDLSTGNPTTVDPDPTPTVPESGPMTVEVVNDDPNCETQGMDYCYGFYEEDGWYVSNNHSHGSEAVVRLNLNNQGQTIKYLDIEYVNDTETCCDYGVFSLVDKTFNEDVYKTGSGDSSTRHAIYIIDPGVHFILIKYTKDGSVSSGSDNLRFRYSMSDEAPL